LAVLMQIDESRSDYQAGDMNDTQSAERIGRDTGNLSVADADVAHPIQTGFRIHDASALEDEIVLLGGRQGG
jgi:hypothetical protein